MSAITTHILDTALGRPARGVPVALEWQTADANWQTLGQGVTDEDGRLRTLLAPNYQLQPGNYRLTFDTGAYLAQQHRASFYPQITVVFTVQDTAAHYHVPLLLAPFGYSTYRGS